MPASEKLPIGGNYIPDYFTQQPLEAIKRRFEKKYKVFFLLLPEIIEDLLDQVEQFTEDPRILYIALTPQLMREKAKYHPDYLVDFSKHEAFNSLLKNRGIIINGSRIFLLIAHPDGFFKNSTENYIVDRPLLIHIARNYSVPPYQEDSV